MPTGSTVTSTNKDEEPHGAVSAENALGSQALDNGESFSFTFKKAGTYKYFAPCTPKWSVPLSWAQSRARTDAGGRGRSGPHAD